MCVDVEKRERLLLSTADRVQPHSGGLSCSTNTMMPEGLNAQSEGGEGAAAARPEAM